MAAQNYGFYQQPLPTMAAKTAVSLQNRTDNVTINDNFLRPDHW